MAGLVEDGKWYPRLVSLAGCLCNELEAAGIQTCFCGVVPGTSPDLSRVFDESTGMGWVRLVQIEPLMTRATANQCLNPVSAQVEVGYAGCFPIEEDGNPLSMEDELDATRLVTAGMEASRRAIYCCDWGAEKGSVRQGRWVPGGPEGGIVWSLWTFGIEDYG